MGNCENCAISCPAILAANEQTAGWEEQLKDLATRETARADMAQDWQLVIANATPEERAAEAIIDGESVGDMRFARDMSEVFAGITRRSDQERITRLHGAVARVETAATTRQESCTKGPGRRFGFVGTTVCRSEVKRDRLPDRSE